MSTEAGSSADPNTPGGNLLLTQPFVPKAPEITHPAERTTGTQRKQQQPQRPPQLAALTGWRACLALWVVLHHNLWGSEKERFFGIHTGDLRFLVDGFLAVDAFFMLSGFIMCYVYCYREKFSYYQFLSARFARIVPLHWTCLLLLLAEHGLLELLPNVSMMYLGGVRDFFKHFFLVQAWSFTESWGFNDVAWSVSAEAFAYFLFPVYMLGCVLSPIWCAFLLGAAAVANVVWLAFAGKLNSYNTLWRIIPEFGLGALLYRCHRHMSTLPKSYIPPFTGCTIIVAVAVLIEFTNRFDIAVLLEGVLLLALSLEKDWLCSLLGHRYFVYAGNVSFAFYLCQRMVERFFAAGRAAHPNFFWQASHWRLSQYLQFVSYFVLLSGMACLFHHGIENPARRFILAKAAQIRTYWIERRSSELRKSSRRDKFVESERLERVDDLPHVALQVASSQIPPLCIN